MTPQVMAEVHAAAFDRPWGATVFEDLCGQAGVFALGDRDGFILVRTVADEAEVLTLAVRPEARRRGLGGGLLRAGAEAARVRGIATLHLEVAEDNAAGLALYRRAGFAETGRRRGYYARPDGPAVDALILTLNLAD